MQYHDIGEKSLVSSICFGCEALGGIDWGTFKLKEIENAIEKSIDLGLNFFDTADIYGLGLSEKRLSRILGSRRHDKFIATKGGVSWSNQSGSRAKTALNSDPEYIKEAIEQSLKRLKLDSLDLYYIHWPDKSTAISETFSLLQKLKDDGKIRHIGCSNFDEIQILEASKFSEVSFAQMPINLIQSPPNLKLLKTCKRLGINVVAYNVLASGLLTGKFNSNSTFSKNDRRARTKLYKGQLFKEKLKEIETIELKAAQYNKTLTQYSINWVLENKLISFAITGIKNTEQAIENLSAIN